MFRKALRVFRSAGYPAGVGVVTANLGWVEVLAGDVDQGMEHLERAVTQFDDLGASAFVFSTRVRVVEALLVGGKCADALDLANSLLGRLADDAEVEVEGAAATGSRMGAAAHGKVDEAGHAIDDAATRAGDSRYERACNDLCRANIALSSATPSGPLNCKQSRRDVHASSA